MNRLPPLVEKVVPPLSPVPPEPPVVVEFGAIERHARHVTPHALFLPMHYEPNYAYPLVIWLHGPGDDERQLQRIMPLVSLRNYLAVGPRGTTRLPDRRGFAWTQEEQAIAQAESSVFACLDLVRERFHIAPQRVFLAGFGNGGTMALRIGLRHPDHFAGLLSLVGAFPAGQMPLARFSTARQMPLFIAQGRDSRQYSIDRSCEELRLFHAAGMSATIRQYPCGDELTTNMLSDMDRWIMEIVTGVSCLKEADTPPCADERN